MDGRRAPSEVLIFGPRARRHNPFFIQCFSDLPQRSADSRFLEDAPHYHCFKLIYLKLDSCLNTHVAIPEAIASGVKSAQCKPFQAAMRFLPEFFNVKGVYQRVDIKKNFRLLILAVEALGNRYDADTDESELLPDALSIPNTSR